MTVDKPSWCQNMFAVPLTHDYLSLKYVVLQTNNKPNQATSLSLATIFFLGLVPDFTALNIF